MRSSDRVCRMVRWVLFWSPGLLPRVSSTISPGTILLLRDLFRKASCPRYLVHMGTVGKQAPGQKGCRDGLDIRATEYRRLPLWTARYDR